MIEPKLYTAEVFAGQMRTNWDHSETNFAHFEWLFSRAVKSIPARLSCSHNFNGELKWCDRLMCCMIEALKQQQVVTALLVLVCRIGFWVSDFFRSDKQLLAIDRASAECVINISTLCAAPILWRRWLSLLLLTVWVSVQQVATGSTKISLHFPRT